MGSHASRAHGLAGAPRWARPCPRGSGSGRWRSRRGCPPAPQPEADAHAAERGEDVPADALVVGAVAVERVGEDRAAALNAGAGSGMRPNFATKAHRPAQRRRGPGPWRGRARAIRAELAARGVGRPRRGRLAVCRHGRIHAVFAAPRVCATTAARDGRFERFTGRIGRGGELARALMGAPHATFTLKPPAYFTGPCRPTPRHPSASKCASRPSEGSPSPPRRPACRSRSGSPSSRPRGSRGLP